MSRSRSAVSCARVASNPSSSSRTPLGRVPLSRSQHRRREAAVMLGASRNAAVNCSAAAPTSPSASSTSAKLKRYCAFAASPFHRGEKALPRLPKASCANGGSTRSRPVCGVARARGLLEVHEVARGTQPLTRRKMFFCRINSGLGFISANCSESMRISFAQRRCSIGRTSSEGFLLSYVAVSPLYRAGNSSRGRRYCRLLRLQDPIQRGPMTGV